MILCKALQCSGGDRESSLELTDIRRRVVVLESSKIPKYQIPVQLHQHGRAMEARVEAWHRVRMSIRSPY